jgi:outer membrane protein OmpA-like peptidoglycan-associated protein
LFEFGSDEMFVGNADDTLGRLSKYLVKPPVYKKIVIEGHTCSIGGKETNRKLSQRRAERIRERLIQKFRLDPKKVEIVGYGSSRPIASNGNFQGRQLNRRVEFKIIRE